MGVGYGSANWSTSRVLMSAFIKVLFPASALEISNGSIMRRKRQTRLSDERHQLWPFDFGFERTTSSHEG
jgi:hypothetical protein